MQKKLYIILSVVAFLCYILVFYFAFYSGFEMTDLGPIRINGNMANQLVAFVLPVSIIMTVWGIILARRAHRNAEKIHGLIVATLLSGSWIILIGVMLTLS
jgi:hypothetical protein